MVENIKRICKEKGTTIAAVERACGFGNGSIRKWDNASPAYERIKAVADFLEVPVSELTGEQKEKPPVDDERFLPLAERREALSRAGIHIMLDADAKVTEDQLDDIISFIEIQQRRNGR